MPTALMWTVRPLVETRVASNLGRATHAALLRLIATADACLASVGIRRIQQPHYRTGGEMMDTPIIYAKLSLGGRDRLNELNLRVGKGYASQKFPNWGTSCVV